MMNNINEEERQILSKYDSNNPVIEEIDIEEGSDYLLKSHEKRKPNKINLKGRYLKKCTHCNWKGIISKDQNVCPMVGCNSLVEVLEYDLDNYYEKQLNAWEEELDEIKSFIKEYRLEYKLEEQINE